MLTLKLIVGGAALFQVLGDVIDLPAFVDIVTQVGVIGALLVWLWMMLTDRLYTKKRVQEEIARTEKAEASRDEAWKLSRESAAATKELATANQAVLDFVRARFTGRS